MKNSHEKFAPASVTKIMTMLLTMEGVDSGKLS
jgi:D-alanyl-D-alanine carboxypeptidase (penicillin-binding protein 5/6)